MKFISSHHRFGLWWLRYLCSCSLQSIFLSLVELLPFPWIRRCLTLVCCAEGVGASVGWSVFPLLILSSGSLLPLVGVFPFLWFCYLSLVCRAGGMAAILIHVLFKLSFYPWLKLSLLVSLPLFISLVCCAEKAWQRSLTSGVNLPPQGDGEQ